MPDTKTRIMDCAERLFADNGISAVSLRKVIAEANVNLAAVHYHFGSKEQLLLAVYERRFKPLNLQRLELLEALKKKYRNRKIPVEEIISAFLKPAFDLLKLDQQQGRCFIKMVGRLHVEADENLKKEVIAQFGDVIFSYLEALSHTLPSIPERELMSRFHFMIGAMANTLIHWQSMPLISRQGQETSSLEELPAQLIQFISAGLKATPVDQLKVREK